MGEEKDMESRTQPMTPEALFYTGLERLFGSQALHSVVNSHPIQSGSSFDTLIRWLLTVTDASGADGLSLVAGREAFDLLLRDHGEKIGLQDTAFRMLPLRKRAQQGFESLGAWFEAEWGWQCRVASQNETMNFHLQTMDHEDEGFFQRPFCYFVEGLFQGLLFWVSGGRFFEALTAPTPTDGQLCCEISFSSTPLD